MKDSFIKRFNYLVLWARSSMDRIPGFGPVDRGSNPRVLVNYSEVLQEQHR